MDDFYVFLKNDRNLLLKQLHFIISLISFLFLISTSTLDSIIVALAIPGTVLNSALLLGLYCLDERHDITDIEILISYGVLNLLAVMVFVNKTLQMDTSIFRMLFMNSYTINILLCSCSGFLMLGEGVYRLIVLLVQNIYNNTQSSKHLNVLFNGIEQNSHKINRLEADTATNTSPGASNFQVSPKTVSPCAEKYTNTSSPSAEIRTTMDEYTDCSHYRLNSESDKHRNVDRRNSGDNNYIPDAGYGESHRHSGDGMHCNKASGGREKPKPLINEAPGVQAHNYFYPKSHVAKICARHQKNSNGPSSSGFNETGLPVFVDRYGKRYIASLAGSTVTASHDYETSSGDCKKKSSTPINEYYTNRKYSNSKLTLIPSKEEVNANDGSRVDSKITHNTNNNNTTNTSYNSNNNISNNDNNTNSIVANDMHHSPKNKENSIHDFITNYNNYLAHLYKNNNTNDGNKLFKYKFYNRNYDYQWVCEA